MKENDLFLDRYLSKIVEDFEGWAERSSKSVNKEWYTDPAPRVKEFSDELEAKFGNKYIKILSGGSAHSFVVNTDKDSKFKKKTWDPATKSHRLIWTKGKRRRGQSTRVTSFNMFVRRSWPPKANLKKDEHGLEDA